MATQALAMPNSTSTPSMSTSGKTALEDRGPLTYFEAQTKPSTKKSEESAPSHKDAAPLTKARPAVKDTAKRGHVYVNLPMQLPILNPNRPLPFMTDHSANRGMPNTPSCTENLPKPNSQTSDPSNGGEVGKSQHASSSLESNEGKSDGFFWSPRCPPDGAAVYDTSPTNSSVSSSPIVKSHPGLTALSGTGQTQEQEDFADQKNKLRNLSLDIEVVSGKLTGCRKPMKLSLRPLSPSLTEAPYTGNNSSPKKLLSHEKTKPGNKSQLHSDSHCPGASIGPLCTHSSASSPPLPLPPPPTHSPIPFQTTGDNPPYYHEHARADELCLNSNRKTMPLGSASDNEPITFSKLNQENGSKSPPVPLPLPPPPPPNIAPAVPRRDPNTALQQTPKSTPNTPPPQSNVPTTQTHPLPLAENSLLSSVEPTNFNTPSTLKDNPSSVSCTSTPTSTPTTASADSPQHNHQNQAPLETDKHSTLKTSSSSSKSTAKHVISRPIPLKGSPETEAPPSPISYHRHNSLPSQTTVMSIIDGRTVVPWNPNSNDPSLKASLPASGSTLQDAVTAALLSQSTILSDATPQWIPPEQSTIRQRLLTGCSNKKVEFIGSADVESVQKQEFSIHSTHNVQSKRPTCLTGNAQQAAAARPRNRPQRSQTEHMSSRSERGSRRHHTTSDMEPIGELNGQHSFGSVGCHITEKQACRGAVPPSEFEIIGSARNQNECQSLSPTEAEWWRAQQRSKMIALAEIHNPARSGKIPADNLFHRQVSAGPTFTLSPTKHHPFPQSEVFVSGAESMDLPRTRFLSSKDHEINQAPHRRQFLEDSFLFHPAQAESLGHNIQFSYPMEQSMQYVKQSRHVPLEADLQRSRSIPNKYRTDMTQSVLSPPISGWETSVAVPVESRQGSSSSGRRRRSKNGILRSHSHRTVDQFKSRQSLGQESPDEIHNNALPPNYYQRCISQTVPAEAISGAWPPVLVQWHHRRPVVYPPDVFDAQSDHHWHPQNDRRTTSGRSAHDLLQMDGKKRLLPHHHSASAIFDRLDMQPWYHFDLPRAAAERILKTKRVGSFLVRQSETCKSEYSLSIRRESDVLHMKISNDPDTGYYVLGEYSQPYPSVSAMIYRYTKSLLPVRGSTPILLQFPVERHPQHHSQKQS
ncbi:hypothetical protein CSKR_200917 [Clonorchis sinensis]|uniref:SH2 domain-containing protein n=1 Tax=Clonorchis sinensis TaxID=79923 RepID=A0A8T1MKB9_CLOSI|nr:hypothetical protein CSKR_200917 [Clonorchis sinensis]